MSTKCRLSACSVGFRRFILQNGGFGDQTPCFVQTLSFVGGSEILGGRVPGFVAIHLRPRWPATE